MSRFASILFISALAACAADIDDGGTENPNPNSPNPNDPNDPNDPSDDPSNPNPGGGPLTVSQYLTALGHQECDDAFTCKAQFPTDAGVTFAEVFGASATACYADAAMYYNATQIQASITAGKITFDGAAAGTCVASFMAPVCSTYWNEGPDVAAACDTALVGKVATGGACTNDFECSGENWCDTATKKCAVPPAGN